MKHEEAKFILSAYRADAAEAGDPAFTEALAEARKDPALAAWLARMEEFDRAVAAKLGEIVPPAGLRETILAGVRMSGEARAQSAWWRRPAWIGVAAGLALLAVATFSLVPKRVAADLASFAAADAQSHHLHGEGEAWADFQSRLAAPATRIGEKLAVDFAELRTTGCRTVHFQGRDVLEVCFNRGGKWYHCYVVRRTDFPSLTPPEAPSIAPLGGVHAATWADDTHLFVVVTKAGAEALEHLF